MLLVIFGIAANVVATGVTELLADDHAPCPKLLTAATRKVYAVPLVNEVTVALAAVDADRENVVQLLPLLLEYCTK